MKAVTGTALAIVLLILCVPFLLIGFLASWAHASIVRGWALFDQFCDWIQGYDSCG